MTRNLFKLHAENLNLSNCFSFAEQDHDIPPIQRQLDQQRLKKKALVGWFSYWLLTTICIIVMIIIYGHLWENGWL